jgi:hypothetical protein
MTKKQRDLKKYNGVHFDKRYGVYTCQLSVDGKIKTNGTYYTSDEAALAYNQLLIKYNGNLKKLNNVIGIDKIKTATSVRRERNKDIKVCHDHLEVVIKSKTRSYVLLIDLEYKYLFEKYSVYIRVLNSRLQKGVYAVFYDPETQMKTYLHRFITKCPSHLVVDHINRNTLDNRLKNLRTVEPYVNSQNSVSKKSKSGYQGIKEIRTKTKPLRYLVTFKHKGKIYRIGSFFSIDEAIAAYNNGIISIRNGVGNLLEQKK